MTRAKNYTEADVSITLAKPKGTRAPPKERERMRTALLSAGLSTNEDGDILGHDKEDNERRALEKAKGGDAHLADLDEVQRWTKS